MKLRYIISKKNIWNNVAAVEHEETITWQFCGAGDLFGVVICDTPQKKSSDLQLEIKRSLWISLNHLAILRRLSLFPGKSSNAQFWKVFFLLWVPGSVTNKYCEISSCSFYQRTESFEEKNRNFKIWVHLQEGPWRTTKNIQQKWDETIRWGSIS